MWRSIIIQNVYELTLKDNWLVISSDELEKKKYSLEDIYAIVLENDRSKISLKLLNALAEKNIIVFLCDAKHIPCTIVLPYSKHYRCFHVLKAQINMKKRFKQEIWKSLIQQKIINQAQALMLCGRHEEDYKELSRLSKEVNNGDKGNREALAARKFFRSLYGSSFIRFNDDIINHCLDYGYAILRGAVIRSLVSYGFNTALGIHHINVYNAYNLADDFIEPLRPIVDMWVDQNLDLLGGDILSTENRNGLVDLLNATIRIDNKNMKIRYAVDQMISSFVTCIESDDCNSLLLPEIVEVRSV